MVRRGRSQREQTLILGPLPSAPMATRWLVVLCLLLTACTSDGSGSGDATTTTEAAAPVEVTVADDLPLLASPVRVHGDIGVYFSVTGTQQRVVAVDLSEPRVLWEAPSHQQGRIRGVVVSPFVDADAGSVVVTQWEPTSGASELVSFDLETGDEQWRSAVGWAELEPERCAGDALLCIPTEEGLAQFDPASGAFVGHVAGGLERTITGSGDLRMTADPAGGRVELGEIVPGGYDPRWTRTLDEFVPAEVATQYGPDGGWTGEIDERRGGAVFWFGALPPPGFYDDEDYEITRDDLRASARAAFMIGLVDEGGDAQSGVHGVYDCRDLPFEPHGFWTCEDIEVIEVEDYDDDGTPDPEPVFRRMVHRSIPKPDGDLVVELPTPIPYFGGGIGATSHPDRFVLTPRPSDGEPMVLDVTTGELSPIDEHRDLVSACALPEELESSDPAEDPLYVELDRGDGETDEYLTVHSPLGVCALDGDPVDPAEALAGGPLASWFGVGGDAEDPVEDDWAATARGWVLWTETDRVLRIARTDPDPTVPEQS